MHALSKAKLARYEPSDETERLAQAARLSVLERAALFGLAFYFYAEAPLGTITRTSTDGSQEVKTDSQGFVLFNHVCDIAWDGSPAGREDDEKNVVIVKGSAVSLSEVGVGAEIKILGHDIEITPVRDFAQPSPAQIPIVVPQARLL